MEQLVTHAARCTPRDPTRRPCVAGTDMPMPVADTPAVVMQRVGRWFPRVAVLDTEGVKPGSPYKFFHLGPPLATKTSRGWVSLIPIRVSQFTEALTVSA
jgi:hypothetical protein